MVSFEHRLKMCQLAFAHLNEVDREKSSQQQNKQTKIVVSDMEYMSWKNAVKDMYVHYCEMLQLLLAHSTEYR